MTVVILFLVSYFILLARLLSGVISQCNDTKVFDYFPVKYLEKTHEWQKFFFLTIFYGEFLSCAKHSIHFNHLNALRIARIEQNIRQHYRYFGRNFNSLERWFKRIIPMQIDWCLVNFVWTNDSFTFRKVLMWTT